MLIQVKGCGHRGLSKPLTKRLHTDWDKVLKMNPTDLNEKVMTFHYQDVPMIKFKFDLKISWKTPFFGHYSAPQRGRF